MAAEIGTSQDLKITDIDVGYSKKGVADYCTKVYNEVDAKVMKTAVAGEPRTTLINAIRAGWQGESCEKYLTKLVEQGTKLNTLLGEMYEGFKAAMQAQGDTYASKDKAMAEEMESLDFLGQE